MSNTSNAKSGGAYSRVPGEDPSFAQWAAAAASELAYFCGIDVGDAEQAAHAGIENEDSPTYEEAVSFLISAEILGDRSGRDLPGCYALAADRRLAAMNMLYALYGNAWREIDGEDCELRLYTDCDPEEDAGTVIALDATERVSGAAGLVIFLLDPVSLERFVCRNEQELYGLYLAVRDGLAPSLNT